MNVILLQTPKETLHDSCIIIWAPIPLETHTLLICTSIDHDNSIARFGLDVLMLFTFEMLPLSNLVMDLFI